jgi:hypothetical protein
METGSWKLVAGNWFLVTSRIPITYYRILITTPFLNLNHNLNLNLLIQTEKNHKKIDLEVSFIKPILYTFAEIFNKTRLG